MKSPQEYLKIIKKVFEYAGSRRMTHIQQLTGSTIYLEVLKLIYPRTMLKTIRESQNEPDAVFLDQIIKFLTKEHGVDLSAVTGQDITEGDFDKIEIFLKALKSIAKAVMFPNNQSEDSYQESSPAPSSQSRSSISNTLEVLTLTQIQRVQEAYSKLGKTDNRTRRTTDVETKKVKYQAYLKNLASEVSRKVKKRKPKTDMQEMHNRLERETKAQVEVVDFQEASAKLKLRDTKQRYIRNVAKVVGQLQRDRINEDKKVQIQGQRKFRSKTHLIIQSLQNHHENNMDLLREQMQKQRKQATVSIKTRKQLGRTLQKEIKTQFRAERDKLRNSKTFEYKKMIHQLENDGIEDMLRSLYKRL